jgi:RNA polymerase sigma-70 factor (ECF subfamily)
VTIDTVLEALFESFAPQIRARVLMIVHDRDIADDICQEAFMTALKHRERLENNIDRLKGWLMVVATNRAIDLLRKNRREIPPSPGQKEISIADQVVSREEARLALMSLAPIYREVIEAIVIGGISSADFARQKGIAPSTVRSQLKRGLIQLRSYFLGAENG